ncbi:ribonuclease Y [Candidatus Gracilibacteria bacterium]|nr:ribonuclease Y [Candidatus Gracilibacteria bacterium]
MNMENFIWVIFGMALAAVMFFILENIRLKKGTSKSTNLVKDAEKKKDKLLSEAKEEQEKMLKEAKEESTKMLKEAKEESNDIIKKAEKIEERIIEREEKIEKKLDEITTKQEDLIVQEDSLKEKKQELSLKLGELENKLSELSKLTEAEAKELFLSQIRSKYEKDALSLIEKHRKNVEDRKKEIAKEIVIKSIQQYAGEVTNETTSTIIEIPSDDIKGKLIGKEGRNIISFERATGVALIIDDTPNSVFLSAFDLYRRYVAKKSLEKLMEDGRIQPARIEEIVQKTTEEASVLLKELGNAALDELGIIGLPDEITSLIGKLRFRTSYGQNILKHSKEVAVIAASIAKDLGVNTEIVKLGGILHDIGKALDHDIEGTHPEIGAKICKKFGLKSEVIDIIENHHNEFSSISIEAAIVQIADMISSVRPGARREAVEEYIKRVKEMENLAESYSGVSKAYAISAGREVRVFVDSDIISDLEAEEMVQTIAKGIEEKISYPGEVKVNLIREKRVVSYAK